MRYVQYCMSVCPRLVDRWYKYMDESTDRVYFTEVDWGGIMYVLYGCNVGT